MIDENTPVLIGVAQVVHRPEASDEIVDAVALMTTALREAADDAGGRPCLQRLDRIAVVQGLWRWPDPARLLADAVGASSATTVLGPGCGSTPLSLVLDASRRVAAGSADVVAICGGEWVSGRSRLRTLGMPMPVTKQLDAKPDERFGHWRAYESDLEVERGFDRPLFIYPLFETAIRHRLGETIDENRDRIAGVVSDLSSVAAKNPYAWRQEYWSADEVREPSPDNPMVVFPYTKRMVSNPKVDMASALLIASVGAARDLGVPEDQWIFPHAGVELDDPRFFSQLDQFDTSANMQLVGNGVLEAAGVGIDEVAVLDLYSCFPSAVQLEMEALGIRPDDDRPLTVTGGMASFGGPIANYVGHALAELVVALRTRPGELGCCVANGGYLNRPAAGIFGSSPPVAPFGYADLSAEAAKTPVREVAADYAGDATVESATVIAARDRSDETGLVTGLDPQHRRVLGRTTDRDTLKLISEQETVGRRMRIDASAQLIDII